MAKTQQKGPPPPAVAETEGSVSVIHLKGTPAMRDWLADVSKKTHIPQSAIARLAFAEWAKRNGHQTPPER